MKKLREASETIKTLEVDKAEFDRALAKMIATPPIRKASVPKRTPWDGVIRRGPKASR